MNSDLGAILEEQSAPPPPKSYLVHAILVTVFCCMPFGIVALINAAKVEDLYAVREYQRAQIASQKAKKWVWIGAGIGFFWVIAVIVFSVFMGIVSAALENGNY